MSPPLYPYLCNKTDPRCCRAGRFNHGLFFICYLDYSNIDLSVQLDFPRFANSPYICNKIDSVYSFFGQIALTFFRKEMKLFKKPLSLNRKRQWCFYKSMVQYKD
jgi:hypothetical protein